MNVLTGIFIGYKGEIKSVQVNNITDIAELVVKSHGDEPGLNYPEWLDTATLMMTNGPMTGLNLVVFSDINNDIGKENALMTLLVNQDSNKTVFRGNSFILGSTLSRMTDAPRMLMNTLLDLQSIRTMFSSSQKVS